MTKEELQQALTMPQFPRSSKYDPEWVVRNEMGPNSLWLCEFLLEKMVLEPGMRVLDMGCGMGMSSVFLAKEFGVSVFANDLWISASDNYRRFCDEKVADKVYPIHAEAHALPYADGFFDAIISLDSYQYYGTDALYLGYIGRFLKQGGYIGIVYPALTREFEDCGPPAYMHPYWDASIYSFHSPAWWSRLWHFSQDIEVEISDLMPDGYNIWLHWDKTVTASGLAKRSGDVELLEADAGNYLTWGRTIGRKGSNRWY